MRTKDFGSLLSNLSLAQQEDNQTITSKIVIKEELKNLIPPLSTEELTQLEENILREGVRDPLILWQSGEEIILIDGHNRHGICTRHSLPFPHKFMTFPGIEEVKQWMIINQLGRRNLSPQQQSYLRGLRYLSEKSQGQRTDLTSYQNDQKSEHKTTASRLAEEYNVGEATIVRDGDFAKGVDKIEKEVPGMRKQILEGKSNVSKADIQELGKNKKDVDEILHVEQKQKQTTSSNNKQTRITLDQLATIAFNFIQQKAETVDEAATRIKLSQPVDPLLFFTRLHEEQTKLK